MSQAPSMPLFCDAYLADTMHLSLEEHGAYLKLLMVTWRNNGVALPDDDVRLARILGVSVARWREKLRPVLVGFFDLSGGTWRSARLEKEWNFVEKHKASQSEKGKKSAAAKALKNKETASTAVDDRLQPQANPQSQSQSQQESGGDDAGATPPVSEHVRIGKRLAEIIGRSDDPAWFGDFGRVLAWLRQGADEALIVATVQAVMSRRKAREPPFSLTYFDEPIASAIADRNRPLPEVPVHDDRPRNHPQQQSSRVGGWAAAALDLAKAGT